MKKDFQKFLCGADSTHIVEGIGGARVAQRCGLSMSHFTHAFRVSTGIMPHGWAVKRRVAMVKELIAVRNSTLAEAALAVGFSD
jgi:AraC-like DNA-binding protein